MRSLLLSVHYGLLSLLLVTASAVAKPLTFTLQEHNLGVVTEQNWPNKYLLIGVGYTSCPDICPTTVIDLATAVNKLGSNQQQQVVPLFISIDPTRDTVENMDLYVKYFDPKVVGLSGSLAQVTSAAKSLKATFGYSLEGKPTYPPLPKQYEVYHSTYIYFYGPDRELIDVYGYGAGGQQIANSIKVHLSE